MFRSAHRKAITNAFLIPIMESIIEYKTKRLNICTEIPIKYLERSTFILETESKKLFFICWGRPDTKSSF